MTRLGESINRIDADAKVKGEAKYPGDFNLPDQAYLKILYARRVHAIVRSVDTRAAEAMPGVLAVLTAKDVPVNEYGLIYPDQPVLCGPGSTIEDADHVRFYADQVALVVADSEEIAARARDAIRVEYEDLPGVFDPREAMKPESVQVHPRRGTNVFCHYRIRKGDTDDAFQKADVIVEGVYETPAQEHAYLQPEAGIAYYDEDGRITVVVGGQWVHEDQEQIAHALGLPKDQVRVIYPAIGGAFGGREDMSVQIVLALAAMRLKERGINRPVKTIWTREESILGHHKRHPYFMKARWGASKEGKILGAEVELVADGGAYIYTSTKVLGNATILCTGPYEIPNVKVDSYAVYTNNIPNGAFRGFGGPQGTFVAECQMNKLAEALGMDAVELRTRNLIRDGSILSVGTPVPRGVSISKVVEECARAGGWKRDETGWHAPMHAHQEKNPGIRRGVGFACAMKNIGFSFGAPEECWATIELYGESEIEKVVLRHAGAEVGQGAHSAFAQMAAHALNVDVGKVALIASDTSRTQNSGSVSASRMTFMAGNAIKGAAEIALARWQEEERPASATFLYRPPNTTMFDSQTGYCMPNFAYGYVAEAVDLSVDSETGEITIHNVVCVDDVGKAVNMQEVTGQIEGAIVQAGGYSVLEKFIQTEGRTLTSKLSTYLIPTVLDIPDQVQPVVLECAEPNGPWGARGMGEMPYLPMAPAVIAAVKDATGKWFDDFPLTPERVYFGLLEE